MSFQVNQAEQSIIRFRESSSRVQEQPSGTDKDIFTHSEQEQNLSVEEQKDEMSSERTEEEKSPLRRQSGKVS